MPPAVGLIAAVGSVGAGMAAVGGTMAGFLGAGLGTQLIAGAMIGGGVLSGIGALTGNTKLQKWGGILSLAGGIGGLATGAWSSTASSVAEQSARESFRAAELGAQSAAEALGGAAGGLADAAGGLMQANAGSDLGMLNSMTGAQPAPMAAGVSAGVPGVTAPSVSMPSGVNLGSQGGVMQTMTKAADGGGMLSSLGDTLSGLGDKVKPAFDWMEKNPRITQAGTGLLTAGLNGYAQQEALKDQMRMQDEAQARARQRMSDSVQGVRVPVYQRKGG